tara:strand:+ start:5788 stop:6180 length:393 start_codon:yes stop_codon:yes gene_type:complete
LIQDDINVAQGLQREKRSHKSKRRVYKHGAPSSGETSGSGGSGEHGSSEESTDGKGTEGAKNPVGKEGKKRVWEKAEEEGESAGVGRKVSSGSEEAFEVVGTKGQKRKRSDEVVEGAEEGGEMKKVKLDD